MARETGKFEWSASEKRRLLDYIRDRKAKNHKATVVDFMKTVVNKLDEAQAARATMKIVQEQVSAIVKHTKKNEKYTATNLWKSGPKILDLNHTYLRGVYSAGTIAEISGVAPAADELGNRKRKPEDPGDHERAKKRSRRDSSSDDLESRLSSAEEVETRTESSKMTLSKQRTKRAREEELTDFQSQPAKKQKTASTNDGKPKKQHKEPIKSAVLPESSDEAEQFSGIDRPKSWKRRVVKLKVKAPIVSEPARNFDEQNHAAYGENRNEHAPTTSDGSGHDEPLQSSTEQTGGHVRGLEAQETVPSTGDGAAIFAGAENPFQPPAQPERASTSHNALTASDEEDQDIALEVPSEYRGFGIPTRSPIGLEIPDDMHSIYLAIMTAVHDHLDLLGIDPDQPVLIKDRAWDDDLAQLMATVFGHQITPEQLAKDFATIQGARTLPLQLLLRSLCAAAVMQWAFRPHPIGFHHDSHSRDARTINAIRRVLNRRFDKGVTAQIFFEATQDAIDGYIIPEIDARAGIFAHRLFMALAPFFQSPQINHWSYVNEPRHLKPLTKEHKDFNPAAGTKNPSTRNILSNPETHAHMKPLPGTTEFELYLKRAFVKALRTRYKWEKSHDGDYDYDFPTFKDDFQKGHHYNEEFSPKESINNKPVPSVHNSRIFVTTMFGVYANQRRNWTTDFSESQLMSRPSVFNLD